MIWTSNSIIWAGEKFPRQPGFKELDKILIWNTIRGLIVNRTVLVSTCTKLYCL